MTTTPATASRTGSRTNRSNRKTQTTGGSPATRSSQRPSRTTQAPPGTRSTAEILTAATEQRSGSDRHDGAQHDVTAAEPGQTPGSLAGAPVRPRAARAGMGALLALIAAAVAAILLSPVALSSRDLLDWAAAPTGLGLPGHWPILVILSLDAAAIACVLMTVLCTWRGEKPGVFGTLIWVFAITSAFANWRHGLAPAAAPDRVWFVPLMSLTGPGVLDVVLHRVRNWISNDQNTTHAPTGSPNQDGDRHKAIGLGVTWQRWIPGLGAFGDTFGAHRTRLLIPGLHSFADALDEFHRLCPGGSVRVAAALRRRHQAQARAALQAVLDPASLRGPGGPGVHSGAELPVDLMKRIPVQPEPYQRWRTAWADLSAATLPARPHQQQNGQSALISSPLDGKALQAIADRHHMSTRQLQFVRRAGEAGLLASPIPPAVLMAQHAAAAARNAGTGTAEEGPRTGKPAAANGASPS